MAPKKKAKAVAETLTVEEEEARSSALIAKLLSRDYGYDPLVANGRSADVNPYAAGNGHDAFSDEYALDDEEMDDEFRPSGQAAKRQKGASKKPRKSVEPEAPAAADSAGDVPADTKEPRQGNTRAVSEPDGNGVVKGAWSKEEEARFLEGLELHGRNWRLLAAHVGTRDSNTVRSKAQKHFIKLFRSQLPLPAKVRESGEGYTLSGKPLDPHSAAAKPYLRLPEPEIAPGVEATGDATAGAETPAEAAPKPKAPKRRKDSSAAELKRAKKAAAQEADEQEEAEDDDEAESVARTTGRTDYSKDRLRRTNLATSGAYIKQLDRSEPHKLHRCRPYGDKHSTAPQPFSVRIKPAALLVSDLHAHLFADEIIGFLGGVWHAQTRELVVEQAFPCKSVVAGSDHVEMDAEAELEVRNLIMDKDLQIVGWYHSHPLFEPNPSLVDLDNQRNYQSLFRDDASHQDPFIGLIVGTYDPRLPSAQSFCSTFHLPPQHVDSGEPKSLRLTIDLADWSLHAMQSELEHVVNVCRDFVGVVRLDERWRPDTDESKLNKILQSLRLRAQTWMRAKADGSDAQMNSTLEQSADADPAAPLTATPSVAQLDASDEQVLTSLEALLRQHWPR